MGMFDKFKSKATDAASEHGDKVEDGLDKAGDAASGATGGKFDDQIETGKDKASEYLGTGGGGDEQGAADEGGDGDGGGEEGGGDRNA